ncbi:uncharacterized protein LOC114310952 [Camellia sinensis]|uniref:uncharacterized protein LOC114310952 n=1 Tax=Camellia sinensis TaxID=4442 RepID=UPI001036DC65|nr:uncharacterized protein LOC114310952 [Camellia sinensis]
MPSLLRSLPTPASISTSTPFSLSGFKSQPSHSQCRVFDCESRNYASIGSPKAKVSTTTATVIIINFLEFYIDVTAFSCSLCFEPPWELSVEYLHFDRSVGKVVVCIDLTFNQQVAKYRVCVCSNCEMGFYI